MERFPRFRSVLALLVLTGCSTVEPGQDFSIADVVYDEDYYYCAVEPVLFQYRCGPGDPGKGDSNGSCHFNVTSYRMSDYTPLMADSCASPTGSPSGSIAPQAKTNYAAAQAKMQIDPKLAPLLNRPTGRASHPRVVFDPAADQAAIQVIEDWATKFSTQ
ncbi:MAG: hypothetical protein U0263_29560 [Polyangiaceae bacterium]